MNNDSNSSCHHLLSHRDKQCILIIYGLLGLVSVLVCLIGIILVVSLKLHRKFVYRLGMYQVIASAFFGFTRALQLIGLFLPDGDDRWGDFCKTTGYATVLSSWIKLFLSVWVTVHLFVFSVFLKNLKKLELLYVASSVLLSPVIAAIPLMTNSYGRAGAWCWITKGERNQCMDRQLDAGEIEQFTVWYGPAFIVLLINASLAIVIMSVAAFRIHFKVWGRNQEMLLQPGSNKSKQALTLLIPLLAYPLFFCILIIIPLVNRLYEAVEHKRSLPLLVATAITIPSMGICAGFAMILHILWMKLCCKPQEPNVKQTVGDRTSASDYETTSSFTVVTKHIIPRESEVDKRFNDEIWKQGKNFLQPLLMHNNYL